MNKEARKVYEDGEGGIHRLPDECLAKAIGLTSPADACRAAAVSAAFQSAADSDAVWERFLPPDCDAVLERAVHIVDASCKKELFMDLCDEHVLIDDGKMSFGLQRSNGSKCYMVCATELQIAWANVDLYWRKRSDPDSRFSKVIELVSVCLLSIYAIINIKELSPGTHYAGYLVFKLTHDASGLGSSRQISFVEVDEQPVGKVYTASLHPCTRSSCELDRECESSTMEEPHEHKQEDDGSGIAVVRYPRQRVDGWLELEMGDFYTGKIDDPTANVKIALSEHEELQWKKGLIVEGIEIRPKN
ncbi:hypothetical protein QYE76_059721 [Lolium multiflorum]|uniref:F-box domain-containing protein n=1 Tax=Lolium multiflorum TaxID=4521 RepID=A0AAD8RXI0_LOLMU|nr:hypothetical protein QYE76_059721 [Lolium multiflorum]